MIRLLVLLLFSGDVRDLGAPGHAVREAAEARLRRWAWLALPAFDREFRDPERRRRARRLADAETGFPGDDPPPVLAAAVPWVGPGATHWPYLDGDQGRTLTHVVCPWWLVRAAPDRAKGFVSEGVVHACWLREATAGCYRWLRRAGLPPRLLDRAVGVMRGRERSWHPGP